MSTLSARHWIISVGVTILTGFLVWMIFQRLFDSSEFEGKAKSLIGRPETEISSLLGKHAKVKNAREFNGQERLDMQTSFSPKPIPMAQEKVYYYDRFPTLILVFVESGKVSNVYVGKT